MDNKYVNIIKRSIKPLGKLLSVLSVLFIIYSVYKLGFDFSSIENKSIFAVIALFGILVKTVTVFITGSAWADWLHLFSGGCEFKKKDAVNAYIKANIGKYLPGNVMHYVERNLFASGLGIGQKRIALSSMAEILCQLAAAFIMAALVSYKYLIKAAGKIFGGKNIIYIVIITVLFAVSCTAIFIFRKKVKAFFNEFGREDLIKVLVITLIKYAAALWLLGFIMAVLYRYMGGHINFSTANLIISCYVIAWVLGFITPGASGGMGVREIVIIFLLGPVVGEELILTLSVIHRLITVIGDFLAYFYAVAINRSKKERIQNETDNTDTLLQ